MKKTWQLIHVKPSKLYLPGGILINSMEPQHQSKYRQS